jgi:hypothetical protein
VLAMARSTMSRSAKSSCWLIEAQALSVAVAPPGDNFNERRICRLLDRRGYLTKSGAGAPPLSATKYPERSRRNDRRRLETIGLVQTRASSWRAGDRGPTANCPFVVSVRSVAPQSQARHTMSALARSNCPLAACPIRIWSGVISECPDLLPSLGRPLQTVTTFLEARGGDVARRRSAACAQPTPAVPDWKQLDRPQMSFAEARIPGTLTFPAVGTET